MVQAEAVPQHDARILHRPILGAPGRKAVIPSRLVDEFACRVALVGIEGSHPELMLNEASAPSRWAVGMNERTYRRARLELVARRPADPILPLRIDDLPVAHLVEVDVALRRLLGRQDPLLNCVSIAIGIFRPRGQRRRVAFDDGVVRSIDLHVEARAEDVLMDVSNEPRRDLGAKLARLTWTAGGGGDD